MRGLLGYTGTADFPDVLETWTSVIHPDDLAWVGGMLHRHLIDSSGRTRPMSSEILAISR